MADPGSFAVLPYTPKCARSLRHDDPRRRAVGCLPAQLSQADDRAGGGARGRGAQASFENEFTLARREGWAVRPPRPEPCFSTIGMDWAAPVMIELVEALHAQGVQPEQYYAELGPGQQEMPVRFADALQAADNQITMRETARGVALKHGLLASFAPKPFPDQAGNGSSYPLEPLADQGRQEPLPRSRRPLRALRGRLCLHRRRAGPPAGSRRAHRAERQLLPPTPTALLVERLHRVGARQSRGCRARAVQAARSRDGIDQPRAQAL